MGATTLVTEMCERSPDVLNHFKKVNSFCLQKEKFILACAKFGKNSKKFANEWIFA